VLGASKQGKGLSFFICGVSSYSEGLDVGGTWGGISLRQKLLIEKREKKGKEGDGGLCKATKDEQTILNAQGKKRQGV